MLPGAALVDEKRRYRAIVRADGSLSLGPAIGSIHKIGALAQGLPACNGWTLAGVENVCAVMAGIATPAAHPTRAQTTGTSSFFIGLTATGASVTDGASASYTVRVTTGAGTLTLTRWSGNPLGTGSSRFLTTNAPTGFTGTDALNEVTFSGYGPGAVFDGLS